MGDGLSRSGPLLVQRLLLALLLGGLAAHLVSAGVALSVPELLETGEPALATAAFRASEGHSLYGRVDAPPFLHHNYTPLGSWMQVPFMWITGPSFTPGRVLSIAATLVLLVLIIRTLGGEGLSCTAAVVGAVAFVTGGIAFPWMFVGRVDLPALALSFGAFVVLTGGPFTRGRAALFLLCALAAWMTKQTAVSGAVAGLVVLALRGRRKDALLLGLAWMVLVALVIVLLQRATDGRFWLHAATLNASHTRDGIGVGALGFRDVLIAVGPLLLGLGGAGLLAISGAVRQRWVVYLIAALGMGVLGLSKSGSHVHHLLETCAVLAVLAGHGWAALMRAQGERPRAGLVAAGLFLVLGAWAFHDGAWQKLKHMHWLATRTSPVPAAILDVLGESEEHVLALGKCASLAIESRREAWLDIADWRRLEELGLVRSEQTLIPLMKERLFALIAVPQYAADHPAEPLFNPLRIAGFRAALEENYSLMRDATGAPLRMDDPKSRHVAEFWRRKS